MSTGRVSTGEMLESAFESLAATDELDEAMSVVVSALRRTAGAAKVEWLAPTGGELRPAASDGDGDGERSKFLLGPAGVLVFTGGDVGRAHAAAAKVGPLVRRRFAEEQLRLMTTQLARRNEALEDFAALVAHELKKPLQAALLSDDPAHEIEQSLDLVDALLVAARNEPRRGNSSNVSAIASALAQIGEVDAHVEVDLPSELPIAPTALQVLLRNLVGNAVSAGAHTIRVAAEQADDSWKLTVDDDGVGLSDTAAYVGGSGIGLGLCRRLARRLGGGLELDPLATGGTRATVTLECAA